MSKFISFLMTMFIVSFSVYADVIADPIPQEPEPDPTAIIKWVAVGVGVVMLISLVCMKLYFKDKPTVPNDDKNGQANQ